MVSKDVVIGLVLGAGVGVVLYGLSVQKEEPRTAQTIFTLIGATAGLLAISTALTREGSPAVTSGLGGLSIVASAFSR